jgi:nitric oxide reductase subunit C
MLSKSSAKAFFLVGTIVCAGAFILLTLDTLQRIPAQTHAENITPQVIRGKDLWDKNNCMGCHTLMGEGAYYAPELTKVYERRGKVFIKAMLTDPEKMYPGQRKMVTYRFNEEEKEDLVAFFKWIGEMDLNGYPAKPNLGQVALPNESTSAVAQRSNRPQVFNQMCVACHSLGGEGGKVGPALDGVGGRRTEAFIVQQLKNSKANLPDSKMPTLPLSESDIVEITAFLTQLK